MTARQSVTLTNAAHASYWRRGAGAPLVYLHSVLPPGDDDAFASALAEHFDVIMPLAPGYADLAEIDDIDDIHDLALHYDDVLRALGLGKVAVVGHSFGGMIAAELAAHFPERVSSLVLISPFGFWNEDHPTVDLSTLPGPVLRKRLTRGDDTLLPAVDPDDPVARTEDAVLVAQAMTSALKFMWPFPDQGLAKRLHRISADSLIVWGTDDDINPPAYADDFAAALPGAKVELVDGGHLLPYESPAQLTDLVLDFVANSASGPAGSAQ
jgi:pimeloyl-ACP methyl ester carboxylesterase